MRKSVIGTGIFNLDTIVVREYPQWPALRPFTDKVVLEEVGGTCGNVLCMLARLGWDAKPLVCLDDSPEGLKIAEDLNRFGCDCRYVTTAPGGGTTLLRLTHKKDSEGRHTLSVRAGSPGGSRFPKRHFLRARDEAPAFLEALTETPAVFFFDDPAPGHRYIARALRERGTLIYFEPSRGLTPAKREAASLSDIVKVSDENWPDVEAFRGVPLLVQTLGGKGVRFSLWGGDWVTLPPVPCEKVVDTEGAGDWTTSVLLDEFFNGGGSGMDSLSAEAATRALVAAQEAASRSIAYMSPKGIIRSDIE